MAKEKQEAPTSPVELVYPLYLDTPMMIGFLAALEGGVTFDADVTRKGTRSSDVAGEVEGEGKVSGWLSTLANLGLRAKASGSLSSENTEEVKLLRKNTEVSLFIYLRDRLKKGQVVTLSDITDFGEVTRGGFIEITGDITRNPLLTAIAPALGSLELLGLTVDEPSIQSQDSEAQLATQRHQKGGRNQPQVRSVNQAALDPMHALRSNPQVMYFFKTLYRLRDELSNGSIVDLLLRPQTMPTLSVVMALSREFLSDASLLTILGGEFTVLGKVTRKLENSGSINLYQRTVLGQMQPQQIASSTQQLNSTEVAPAVNPSQVQEAAIIKPPALEVIPLAIFI